MELNEALTTSNDKTRLRTALRGRSPTYSSPPTRAPVAETGRYTTLNDAMTIHGGLSEGMGLVTGSWSVQRTTAGGVTAVARPLAVGKRPYAARRGKRGARGGEPLLAWV